MLELGVEFGSWEEDCLPEDPCNRTLVAGDRNSAPRSSQEEQGGFCNISKLT